jgi:integrase
MAAGHHADGRGLYLRVSGNGAMSWSFRWKPAGSKTATEIGLGSFTGNGAAFRLTLDEARMAADEKRGMIARGIDPREQKARELGSKINFRQVLDELIIARKTGQDAWKVKGGKCAREAAYRSTVKNYGGDTLLNAPINKVTKDLMLSLLRAPNKQLDDGSIVWASVMGRDLQEIAEQVVGHAISAGYIDGPANPVAWEGVLQPILKAKPSRSKDGFKFLPWDQLPAIWQKAAGLNTMGAKVVQLAILAAVRPTEAREAQRKEFDLVQGLWTIPAERMKMGEPHIVPLTQEMRALIEPLMANEIAGSPYLFAVASGKPISKTSVDKVVTDHLGLKGEATLHGMRKTFSGFITANTTVPPEVREMALSHKVKGVAGVYMQDELIHKRRLMLTIYGNYATGVLKLDDSNVLRMEDFLGRRAA